MTTYKPRYLLDVRIRIPHPAWILQRRLLLKKQEGIAKRHESIKQAILTNPLELEPEMVWPSCTPQGACLRPRYRRSALTGLIDVRR